MLETSTQGNLLQNKADASSLWTRLSKQYIADFAMKTVNSSTTTWLLLKKV